MKSGVVTLFSTARALFTELHTVTVEAVGGRGVLGWVCVFAVRRGVTRGGPGPQRRLIEADRMSSCGGSSQSASASWPPGTSALAAACLLSSSSWTQLGYLSTGLSFLPLRANQQPPASGVPMRSGPHGTMWQSDEEHAGWPPPQPKARCAAGLVKR